VRGVDRAVFFSGLWFVPTEERMLSVHSEELADLRKECMAVPLPSLHGIPRGVLRDGQLFDNSYEADKITKNFWFDRVKLHDKAYAEVVSRWWDARADITRVLNLNNTSEPRSQDVCRASGHRWSGGQFKWGNDVHIINSKVVTKGVVEGCAGGSLNLASEHEILFPNVVQEY